MAPAGVAVTVEKVARAAVPDVFQAIAPVDLSRIFTGYGPLPAVAGTRDQTGDWDHVGATRTVELSDGTVARERITAYEPPAHFAYRVSGFTGRLRLLVTHVDGAWWFTETDDGTTEIRWTYTFQPRPGRGALVYALVARLWKAYAQRVLALAIGVAEEES